MKSYFFESPPQLIGFQPNYHWAKETHNIQGDSIVSFIAPQSKIRFYLDPETPNDYSALHLLVEHFDITERELRLYQRLLADIIVHYVGPRFGRYGIELYVGTKQISTTKTLWRPISSIYYLSLPIITPSKKPENLALEAAAPDPEKWYDDVKSLALDAMQSFTNDVRAIQYGNPTL